MKKLKDGVWLADSGVMRWTTEDIAFLECEAPKAEKKRARICAHQANDRTHQMLIAFCRGSESAMHSHVKPESMLVLKGVMAVEIQDNDPIMLYQHNYLRIPAGVMHKPIPITDCVVLETAEK